MNQKIFDAALKFERIFNKSMSEIQELKSKTGNISQEKYMEYPLDDRKKMFDILRKFFTEESGDDFVTIFGVYCNHYVKKNYHMILPEKDFGISELWNVITDNEFQKYLLLIQQGIYEQKEKFFEDAQKLFDEYSLPHLYLFVFSAGSFDWVEDSNKKEEFLKFMQEHYNKMNAGLRGYVLGTGNFIRESYNPALDENPLPYVKAVDKRQDYVFNIAKAMMDSYPTYKQLCEEAWEKALSAEQMLEFQMASAVMKEKLEALNTIFNSDESYHIDDDNNYKATWRDNYAVAFRIGYLNIPVKISNAGSFLLDQMEKLRLKSQRDELIADFTHTCKNLNATNLGSIAESLLKMESEQEKNWGRALLLEFARKDTLNKKVTMLNMRYEGDSKKLVETLEESLADEGNGIGISEVLQMTALNCFVEFFYDEGDNSDSDAKRMRKRASKLWKDRDAKKISFENEVIFNQKNCIDWMTENGFRLQIKIDERWQKIYLQRNDYAEVFFRDIFLEMMRNFLKYGEVTEPVEMDLHSDENTLKISMRNLIAPKFMKDFKKSTNRGLIAMNNTLEILYIGKGLNVPEKCVMSSQNVNFFILELTVPAEIFLKGEDDK